MQLVWEIAIDYKMGLYVQPNAVMTLQDVSEAYLIGPFEDTSLCVIHIKHVIIITKDIQLDHHIHGELPKVPA